MKNSKAPAFLLKLVISLGLVSFFLWHIDLLQIHEALTKTKFGYLLIGLLLYPLGQVICAVKWQYLARALGIHRDLKSMVGLYFIGMFFNLFLPTGVGGDITRGLYLKPEGKTRSSFLSVFVERATGFLSLVILCSIVMLSSYGEPLPPILRYGFPAASVVALIFIAFLPYILGKTRTKMRRIVHEDLIVFWKEPRIAVIALLYSATFHAVLVAIHVCIARSLSIRVPIPYHFVTLCIASLASLLPSFNGIGVREGAYIYLLSLIRIGKAYGLLFSLLWFMIMVLSSLIGGVVYLIRGLSPQPTISMVDQN
ncbi:MAG TPA: lysylphosphatidylglycerol synthase transmembrane domain-containing protein [Acidobacteriota bacterium]